MYYTIAVSLTVVIFQKNEIAFDIIFVEPFNFYPTINQDVDHFLASKKVHKFGEDHFRYEDFFNSFCLSHHSNQPPYSTSLETNVLAIIVSLYSRFTRVRINSHRTIEWEGF